MSTAADAIASRKVDPVARTNAIIDDEIAHLRNQLDLDKIYFDIVRGYRDFDARDVVIDAEFEESIDKTPTFTVVVHDPDWHLLNSGALERAIDIRINDHRIYRLDAIEVVDDDVTLTFITRNAAYLMSHTKRKKANRAKVTRAEFILSLVRSVKKQRIGFVCPELHKKQPIEKRQKPKTSSESDRDREPGLSAEDITVKGKPATIEQAKNIAAVLLVGWRRRSPKRAMIGAIMCITQEANALRGATNFSQYGAQVGLFQQRPSAGWPATRDPYKDAPPFYEKLEALLKSNPGANLGVLVDKVQVAGTPSAFDQWEEEATRTVNVFLGGEGLPSVAYKKRYEFETQEDVDGKPETYLAAIYRLAEQVNWRAFWVNDNLHYMSEEDLFRSRPRMKLRRYEDGVESITFGWDRSKKVNQMIVRARMDRWLCPIGTTISFTEGGPAKGRWLVTNIRRSIFNELGEITLSKPVPEKKEPANEISSRSPSGGTGITSSGGAKGIVDDAVKIAIEVGGRGVYMVSGWRGPNSVTTQGTTSDHSRNDPMMAARDIGVTGLDPLVGPPSSKLDRAVAAIGDEFGRNYGDGKHKIVDTFEWNHYRVQIIWRTPDYGGHMGHIHIGVRALS